MLRRLALADALILRPPHAPALPGGRRGAGDPPRFARPVRLVRVEKRERACRQIFSPKYPPFLDELVRTYLEHGIQLPLCSENRGEADRTQFKGKPRPMLTRKQHELLVYIDRHLKQTGFSPSFEEMKEALQLKSKSGIHRLISALEERGFIGRRHHRARALEVLRLPEDTATRAAEAGRRGRQRPTSPPT